MQCNMHRSEEKGGGGGVVLRDMPPISLGIPLESGQFVFVMVNLLKMSDH